MRTHATCAKCERQADAWAAKVSGVPGPRSRSTVLREPTELGTGQPLAPDVRTSMEQRFGHDFRDVRVHDDATADRSTRSLSALAFTRRNDIAFRAGHYQPATAYGRNLLGHELAHVVQQRTQPDAPSVQARVIDDDDHFPCRTVPATAGDAGRAGPMTTADLNLREERAATLATNAASALRAAPLAETTRRLLWERFRLDYNEPRVRCRQVATLADRYEAVASGLRGTDHAYRCTTTGEPHSDCATANAVTYVGLTRYIALCSRFFGRGLDAEAVTLLHEWIHYDFTQRGAGDERTGGFDNAACYGAFASELAGSVDPTDGALCTTQSDPLPARDDARIGLPCPGNAFVTTSLLGGGLATGHSTIGSRGMFGVGLDLDFPLTRMHDWELSVGPRFGVLPPSAATERTAYLLGLRVGARFRYRPWRFGGEVGGYLEGGALLEPDRAREQTSPYGLAGVRGALNFHPGRDTALQIFGEVAGGVGLDRHDDRSFGLFQAGLGVALQFQ